MFGIPKEALGAIVAALVAAIVSLLGLIISKEQKVSEFRQAWIDALRENVASVITHAEAVRGAMFAAQPNRAAWVDVRDHYVAINQAITCIRLRLNPNEELALSLLECLNELEAAFHAGNVATSTRINPIVEKLTERCGLVLKDEWLRVRAGESTYRWARYCSLTVVIVAAVLLAISVVQPLLQPIPQRSRPRDCAPNCVPYQPLPTR